ncbi:MAG: hypothetical protein U0237_08120 [Thermoleophilia bacterium]
MSSRRPPVPPPRSGKLFWLLAVLLNVAVPGVGHIYAQMIVRGFVWLAGNMVILLILTQGDVPLPGLLGALGALRVAAVGDLVYLLKNGGSAGDSGNTGNDR